MRFVIVNGIKICREIHPRKHRPDPFRAIRLSIEREALTPAPHPPDLIGGTPPVHSEAFDANGNFVPLWQRGTDAISKSVDALLTHQARAAETQGIRKRLLQLQEKA